MTANRPHHFLFKSLLPLLLIAALGACNKKSAQPENEEKPDPMLVKAAGPLLAQVKVDAAHTAPISDTIRVAGRIDFDEQRLARIGSSVNGRVTDLYAHARPEREQGRSARPPAQ